jgi:hypothetical protein
MNVWNESNTLFVYRSRHKWVVRVRIKLIAVQQQVSGISAVYVWREHINLIADIRGKRYNQEWKVQRHRQHWAYNTQGQDKNKKTQKAKMTSNMDPTKKPGSELRFSQMVSNPCILWDTLHDTHITHISLGHVLMFSLKLFSLCFEVTASLMFDLHLFYLERGFNVWLILSCTSLV